MKNNIDFKLVFVISVILALIIAGTVMAYVGFPSDRYEKEKTAEEKTEIVNNEELNTEKEDKENPNEKSDESDKSFDYVYHEYIDANAQYFDAGMVLCDLNEDGFPEVFSLTHTEESLTALIFHEFKDGKIVKPSNSTPMAHADTDSLIKETTFWLAPKYFTGVYRHKDTKEKSIIISAMNYDEQSVFDIITYDGNKLRIEHRADEIRNNNNGLSFFEKLDRIMINYELCNERLYSGVQLRGAVDSESVKATFDQLKEEFTRGKGIEYTEVLNGEVECYIRNINMAEKEIELIPVSKITYEEFEKAKSNGGAFRLNNEDAKIIWNNENIYDAEVYMMPGFSYYFEAPLDPGDESLISEYFGNKPFKVKMGEDFRIIYEPAELLGNPLMKDEYSMEEYLPQYASLKMLNCCVAQISDEEISSLKILYHP